MVKRFLVVGLIALAACMTQPEATPVVDMEDVVRLSLVEVIDLVGPVRVTQNGVAYDYVAPHDDWDDLMEAKVDQDGRRWKRTKLRTDDDVPIYRVYDENRRHLMDVAVGNVVDAKGQLILAMRGDIGYVLQLP